MASKQYTSRFFAVAPVMKMRLPQTTGEFSPGRGIGVFQRIPSPVVPFQEAGRFV